MITFIRRIENLEYMEAVKLLADRCGLELPMDSDQSDARSMLKKRVLEINRESARFFHSCLMSEQGRQAYECPHQPRQGPQDHPSLWIGLCTGRLGRTAQPPARQGFFGQRYAGSQCGDQRKIRTARPFFKPSHLSDYRPAGQCGRLWRQGAGRQGSPSISTPRDTPVFKKSKHPVCPQLCQSLQGARALILAEGYMDVIAIHQAGFDNAVATLGTCADRASRARLISQYAEPGGAGVRFRRGRDRQATKRAIEYV